VPRPNGRAPPGVDTQSAACGAQARALHTESPVARTDDAEIEEGSRAMGSASKSKQRLNVTRADAARRLQTLAKELEEGTLRLGDKTFPIPEQMRLSIKADSDELEIELKWVAADVQARSDEEEQTLTEEQASPL
jgi:amphi-Trp domain-containing protein